MTSTLFLQAAPVETIDDLLDPDRAAARTRARRTTSPSSRCRRRCRRRSAPTSHPRSSWCRPASGCCWPRRSAGPKGRYLAVDLLVVTERREEKRGGELDRPQRSRPPGPGARRRRQHLVDRCPRGLGQAHRRGVARICARASGCPSRSSPTTWCAAAPRRICRSTDRRPATGQARAALPLPNPVPALRRSVPGAAGAARRATPEYGEGYGLDRLRELDPDRTGLAATRESGTHLYQSLATLFRLVDQGHARATAATADGDDAGTEGLTFNAAARRPVRARRPPRSSTRSGSATKPLQRVLRAPAAVQGVEGPQGPTAASSPTPNSASTSSARCTRG